MLCLRFTPSAKISSTGVGLLVLIKILKFHVKVVPNLVDSLRPRLVKLGQSSIKTSHFTDYVAFGTVPLDSLVIPMTLASLIAALINS